MIVKRTSPSVLIFINLQKSCFGQRAVHACSAIVQLLFTGVKEIARKLKTSLMIVNMRYKTCLIGYKTSMEMKLREASFSVKLYIWNKRSTIFGALIGALTLSLLLKLPPRKLEPEFFVLYLYKSTIRSCVKCCCHVWAGTPICYLELLD